MRKTKRDKRREKLHFRENSRWRWWLCYAAENQAINSTPLALKKIVKSIIWLGCEKWKQLIMAL